MAGVRPGSSDPRVEPVGDAALLVTLGDDLDLALNDRAHRLAAQLGLRAAGVAGLGVAVPGHASVLVPFDPDLIDEATVRDAIAAVLTEATAAVRAPVRIATPTAVMCGQSSRTGPDSSVLHEIPVSYGGTDGPDLAEVAARTRLTEREVVRLHAETEYRVLVLGFVPGFPYLGILPAALDLPRRATPRVRVPAGSVAITGRQCGIYPFETPGGWHLIGRTDASLWDPQADPPARLAPGDRVRFVVV